MEQIWLKKLEFSCFESGIKDGLDSFLDQVSRGFKIWQLNMNSWCGIESLQSSRRWLNVLREDHAIEPF